MIIDIFAVIDDAPLILKRPLLPYGVHYSGVHKKTYASYRLPVFAKHEPQTEPWYYTDDRNITAMLVGGRRYPCMAEDDNGKLPLIPDTGSYTIHVENDAAYICIGFDSESLWMYQRVEIIGTSTAVYSQYGSRDPDGDRNPPMILSVPDIKKKADALKYARFTFESVKTSFIKENQSIFLYGGEMVLTLRHKEDNAPKSKDYPLGKFIINRITHDMNEAHIDGIDYRSLLNRKYPADTDTFTRDNYPYLQDEYINKVKPAMLGHGNGVPGIPLNGLQIYMEPPEGTFPGKIDRYDFQFPKGWIGKPVKIEIKMSGNSINEVEQNSWVEVYPGLGSPHIRDGNAAYQPNNSLLTDDDIDAETGIVSIDYRQALQNGARGNDPNEVRMFAEWRHSKVEEAVAALLDFTGDNTLSETFDGEFDCLGEIGLYMDDSKSIFEWIEQLQSANVIGGQLMQVNNSLFYRLENPNRPRALDYDIPPTDALNHETLAVSMADEFIYSGWDIVYKKSWAGGAGSEGHIVGTNDRYPAGEVYNGTDLTIKFEREMAEIDGVIVPVEKFNTDALQKRVRVIKDLVNTFRHKITGLTLPMTHDYLELLIYDVIGYTPKVLENSERPFYEWIIYDKKYNLKNETVTLALVERVKTDNWP